MGTFEVEIGVGDPEARTFETVQALVDTGASYTQLPASMLRRLGVTPHTSAEFDLADGHVVENEIGRTWVQLDGRRELVLVMFDEAESTPLLGAVTLEGFLLAPDAVSKRLVLKRGRL